MIKVTRTVDICLNDLFLNQQKWSNIDILLKKTTYDYLLVVKITEILMNIMSCNCFSRISHYIVILNFHNNIVSYYPTNVYDYRNKYTILKRDTSEG